MVKHLREFDDYAKIKPAVNQCEFHPHNTCPDLLNYCSERNIHFQAYSSLGSPRSRQALFKEPSVLEMCRKYDCQPAQLLLAWAINQNVSVLPKTVNLDHLKSNVKAANISIQKSDIDLLKNLKTVKRYCWDPTAVA
uniref:NADP-dependent oxidoreductase domain-containing protein n=1 Tax=Romanomermis culicivorax TaxID=13658 RepID=A0A915IP61_ROMCU